MQTINTPIRGTARVPQTQVGSKGSWVPTALATLLQVP